MLPKNRADFKVFVILPTDIMYRIETGSPQASDNGSSQYEYMERKTYGDRAKGNDV